MSRRHGLLSVLVLLVPAAASAPASAAALPDLQQVAPYTLSVVQRDGRWYLGFATAVRNVGSGALRIQGQGSGDGTMSARQLSEDGLEVLHPDVGTLRYVSSYGHGHWHYMDFMRYELRGVDVRGLLRDQKQGFCLSDAPAFVEDWCAPDQPALTTTDVGIQAGGADHYKPHIEGQEIPIDPDTAPSGRYVLTSRIGQTGVLSEVRTDNNVAATLIELRWPMTHGQRIPAILSCVGKCAEALLVPRMTATDARQLARRALRRTIGRLPARRRLTCRASRRERQVCRVRLVRGRVSFRGSVRVWYARKDATTRWYYGLDLIRRARDCSADRCDRRIRRVQRPGGTVRA